MTKTWTKKTIVNPEKEEKHKQRKTKKQILNNNKIVEWDNQLKDFYASSEIQELPKE